MASKANLLIAIMVAAIASSALATDYAVGDSEGWTLGVNYTAWAQGKQFYVGDRLVFVYQEGAHNVYKVNGTDFQQCTVPSSPQPLTSGNDTITLATPGRKWYICGVGNHCDAGMKLVITVYPTPMTLAPIASGPSAVVWAPAPGPEPAAQMMNGSKKTVMSFWRRFKLDIHM